MTQNNLINQIVEVMTKHSKPSFEAGEGSVIYQQSFQAAATEIAALMSPPEPNQSESITVVFKNKQGDRKTVAIPVEKLTEHFGDFFYDELENTAPKCNCTSESNSHCECTPIFEDYEIASAFITPAALHPLTKIREEVERLRDEADRNRAMFARDCNPNYAYQSIGAKEACNHILSLLTQENDGWISVEDRLPEVGKDYLVTDGDACMVAAFRLEKQEWDFWNINWWTTEQITHWQPLPSPPKSK